MKTILNRAYLESKTIRQLKAMASGKGISKARYGKPWSDMTKAELVQAISDYHRVMNSAPKSSYWQTMQETPRINTTRADGHLWTACIGFKSQQEANRFYYWLLPQCSWALVRQGERTGSVWEVKVWGMSHALLDELIARDTPKVKASALDDRSAWTLASQRRATIVCGVSID
jgi:hypothetical protein